MSLQRQPSYDARVARHVACGDAPPNLVHTLNLGMAHKEAYLRLRPFLQPLCDAPDSVQTKRLVAYPRYYAELAAQRPETRTALEALWEVCLSDFGLQQAFPPTDSNRGKRLQQYIANSTQFGSIYAAEILNPYKSVFLSTKGY